MYDWKTGDLAKCIDPECGYDPVNGKHCALHSEHLVTRVTRDSTPCEDCGHFHTWLSFPGFVVEWTAESFVPVTKLFDEPKMRVKELT